MLSFFPRRVLDEIFNLIESVSEGFSSYSSNSLHRYIREDLLKAAMHMTNNVRIFEQRIKFTEAQGTDTE